ncbi:hypothetical protein CTP10_R79900 (plasmid) [Cupriavidus sp. P-10]|uniref:hypothetical protein n=1 Tax=unclassified Cupriavidus TaxID=2640874 RepID=UPI0011C10F0E|nr:hypothetical protein [Cupriavidus sp. P-10]BDB30573.1 hypothetical protein CTP10_R79900 [Cupriavidus sp. P-10]
MGDRDRQPIAAAIRAHFRFRWLSSEVVRAATSALPPLVSQLNQALTEEECWRAALHPVLKSSPLALPERGFCAEKSLSAVWSMCEAFNKEDGFFEGVARRVQAFKNHHLKKWDKHSECFFIDVNQHVWKDEGPYHGDAPFPRDWKYSTCMPNGFHFDVQHQQGRAFEYIDAASVENHVAATQTLQCRRTRLSVLATKCFVRLSPMPLIVHRNW